MKSIRIQGRAFTLIELVVVVAAISILAATAASMYDSYIRRSKTQEAITFVPVIANGEAAYYVSNNSWIDVGPTNIPPSTVRVTADFDSGNWKDINFKPADPILFGYRGYLSGSTFIVEAQGDQDGDGDVSLFSMQLTSNNGLPVRGGLYFIDELE